MFKIEHYCIHSTNCTESPLETSFPSRPNKLQLSLAKHTGVRAELQTSKDYKWLLKQTIKVPFELQKHDILKHSQNKIWVFDCKINGLG